MKDSGSCGQMTPSCKSANLLSKVKKKKLDEYLMTTKDLKRHLVASLSRLLSKIKGKYLTFATPSPNNVQQLIFQQVSFIYLTSIIPLDYLM